MIQIPKIGTYVKVTTEHPDIFIFSKNKNRKNITIGQIVPNDKFDPIDSFCITTGKPEFPIAVIALRNVVSIEVSKKILKQKIQKTLPKTWKVRSSKKKDYYTVMLDNNFWSCSCIGFQYHRRCKHVKLIKEKQKVD